MNVRACVLIGLIALGAAPLAQTPTPPPTRPPDVLFLGSEAAVVDAMFALAEVSRRDVVYDLGAGDGRIVIAAAKRFGARGVGVEIDPALVRTATEHALAAGVADRVRFVLGDIFDPAVPIGDATVVTLFLRPDLNRRLRPRLWRDLKPGTRVVSNSFDMGAEWPPDKTAQTGDYTIYFWRVPPT